MPQDILATCNGCGKKLSIEHTLSCPKVDLIMVRHYDNAKEWVALVSRSLVPSAITYKPKINSRTVQGEKTRAGARQDGGAANGGVYTVGDPQGGRERKFNGAAILVGRP